MYPQDWLLALSVVLIAATVWLVRRRAASAVPEGNWACVPISLACGFVTRGKIQGPLGPEKESSPVSANVRSFSRSPGRRLLGGGGGYGY